MKNEPALRVSGSPASRTIPLPRRRREDGLAGLGQRRSRARLDAEGARELGVGDRRAERRALEREGDLEHRDPVLVLERARAVAEAELGRRPGAGSRRSRGRARAPRPASARPPGRRRRRSGSASRRSSRGSRTGTRGRPGPRPRVRATTPSHGSPAGDAHEHAVGAGRLELDAARLAAHDRAGHAGVGDHDVRAAAEQERRRARCVGLRQRLAQLLVGRAAHERAGGTADAQRRQRGEGDLELGGHAPSLDGASSGPGSSVTSGAVGTARPGSKRPPCLVLRATPHPAGPGASRERGPGTARAPGRRPSAARARHPRRQPRAADPAPASPSSCVLVPGSCSACVWLWLRDSPLVSVNHVEVTGATGPDADASPARSSRPVAT